ncbi:MAG: lytic transglycosylase domain-containing protein [Acidobacteria bacterium]|nr:lytic transglycosylase domain-containing protein [Acidobacteriota bacterium]
MSRKKFLVIIFLAFICLTSIVSYFAYYHHLHQYDSMIIRVSSRYNLDPMLVYSVIYEESYFKKDARSSAGAIGLMQVTPIIVKEWTRITSQDDLNKAFPLAIERSKNLTEEELLACPEINLQLGCWYLDHLMKRYGELKDPLPIVLASYNAGPSNGQRWQQLTEQGKKNISGKSYRKLYIGQIDFPETKKYVTSVLTRYISNNQNTDTTDKVSSVLDKE